MNAWRCSNWSCRKVFLRAELGREGKVLTCPDCGSMVCKVTNTNLGQRFLAIMKKSSSVPSDVQYRHMNKKLRTFDEGSGS